MAIVWTLIFMCCVLCTSSQQIYFNEKYDCNSDEKRMEEIHMLHTQQTKLRYELDELRQENKENRALLTNYSSIAKELKVLETKNQRLEQDYVQLQQELSAINDRISENQNMTLANTRRLNDCPVPFDCYDIYNCGIRKTGIYRIYPYIKVNNVTSVLVMCDMESSGGGWTVIQHRNRDNPFVNFNTTWDEYKRGFGDVNGNYWLGNNAIHKLTTTYNNSLYIRLQSTQKNSYEVQYSLFSISNETDGYRLSLGQKSGNIDDAFRAHSVVNHPFSTFDHDRRTCAARRGSGWWYYSCTVVNLNAPFSGGHIGPVCTDQTQPDTKQSQSSPGDCFLGLLKQSQSSPTAVPEQSHSSPRAVPAVPAVLESSPSSPRKQSQWAGFINLMGGANSEMRFAINNGTIKGSRN